MGRKSIPGLIKRNGTWHIDKVICGRRVCQSTGTDRQDEAEKFLARLIDDARQAQVYGVRPSRRFEEAAAKYVIENQRKRSIGDDVSHLRQLMPWIGAASIDRLHRGTLEPWVSYRRRQGRSAGTINHGLKVVRRILNLAATEWVDDAGLTWLSAAPKIKLLSDREKRSAYPLSWDEQERLFCELPDHLAEMALFAVNTGCRDQEICQLRWEWEVNVPELDTSVFIIPGFRVKNSEERLVVLNSVAGSVVASRRKRHATHVFDYDGRPLSRMLTSAWKRARARADLQHVRVHDLKHTFGRRLRAAGVSFEDRQDLLGHRSGRITTHYSAVELTRLIEAAERISHRDGERPELVVLRGTLIAESRKSPAHKSLCQRVDKAKSLKSLVPQEGLEPPTP